MSTIRFPLLSGSEGPVDLANLVAKYGAVGVRLPGAKVRLVQLSPFCGWTPPSDRADTITASETATVIGTPLEGFSKRAGVTSAKVSGNEIVLEVRAAEFIGFERPAEYMRCPKGDIWSVDWAPKCPVHKQTMKRVAV